MINTKKVVTFWPEIQPTVLIFGIFLICKRDISIILIYGGKREVLKMGSSWFYTLFVIMDNLSIKTLCHKDLKTTSVMCLQLKYSRAERLEILWGKYPVNMDSIGRYFIGSAQEMTYGMWTFRRCFISYRSFAIP